MASETIVSPDEINVSWRVNQVLINPKLTTRPDEVGPLNIGGIPVVLDPALPDDEIRMVSGRQMIVLRLKELPADYAAVTLRGLARDRVLSAFSMSQSPMLRAEAEAAAEAEVERYRHAAREQYGADGIVVPGGLRSWPSAWPWVPTGQLALRPPRPSRREKRRARKARRR